MSRLGLLVMPLGYAALLIWQEWHFRERLASPPLPVVAPASVPAPVALDATAVAERLPGGSVLRRVEANQVVLWNKGREERLTLQPPVARFLRRLGSPGDSQASAISTRYLRPVSGPSE